MNQPQVAISQDFMFAYSELPRNVQARAREFMSKFRADPTSSGINYEKIHDAADGKLYSVRIDQTYRGIVARQPETGIYLLLWVDHHDDAYDWARRRKCDVNTNTGAIQVYSVEDQVAEPIDGQAEHGLFDHVSDDELIALGVPRLKLTETRAIRTKADFYSKRDGFPPDAYEGLEFIANGFPPDEVLRDLFDYRPSSDETPQDSEDFAAALQTASSLKSFAVVEGEDELLQMLAAPLERWRVFLHPTQRKLVTRQFNGPARVTGGAGTGKTVVAMHRAKFLAEQSSARSRILFTTFTTNLAQDIHENLRKICSTETLKKIEVTHMDAWVSRFLREAGYDFRLVYGDELQELWEEAIAASGEALDLSRSFFEDEWSRVVHAQQAYTRQAYVKASRIGRGVPLNRKKRLQVWNVFEEFRSLLDQRRQRDIETAMHECCQIIEQRAHEPLYTAVVVDEGQDLSMSAYRLIRTIAGAERANDIFIVGDTHQRIYKHRAVLSHCGIQVRGRSSYLRVNYRTTEEIRSWAFGLLQGLEFDDMDGSNDPAREYQSLTHGDPPVIQHFSGQDQELDYVLEELRRLVDQGTELENICLAARTRRLLDTYRQYLSDAGFRCYSIRGSKVDDRTEAGLRLATMHRVKGLEFDCVFAVSVNQNVVPLAAATDNDDVLARVEAVAAERNLLYVTVTRAKRTAYVTSFGQPSEFLPKISASDE